MYALILLAAFGAIAALLVRQARGHQSTAQGRALFTGELAAQQALPGRLAGHTRDLPLQATRCTNCHTATTGAPSGFAPPLNAATLTQPLARRGGPPSAYDAAGLCRLLREGIDPAWIMVDQAMPRYAATDAQCAALWAWLSTQTS